MKIISLGGVGGCVLTQSIQNLVIDQERFPYDWLLSNQSFVTRTLLDNETFFNFDDETKICNSMFVTDTQDGLSIHDFLDFDDYMNTRNDIKEKYIRRFDRLNKYLTSDIPILFIRVTNNTPQQPSWLNIFESIPDNIPLWFEFIQNFENKYKKPIHFLIITYNKEEYDEFKYKLPNVENTRFYLRFFDNSNLQGNDENVDELCNIIYDVQTIIG
jgi:hypothetical protein